MPLSREQARALTRCVHLLRPAWSEEGIYASLAKCKARDAFEVAMAAIRAAADKDAKTPGVIPAGGSHWNEPDPTPRTQPRLSREERRARTCHTCGALDGCKPPTHPFVPLDHASRDRVPAEDSKAPAQLRALLQSTRASLCPCGVKPTACEAHDPRRQDERADLARRRETDTREMTKEQADE